MLLNGDGNVGCVKAEIEVESAIFRFPDVDQIMWFVVLHWKSMCLLKWIHK